jgi:hypothetical protein
MGLDAVWASAGLIHDRPPVAELVRRFIDEYPRVLERLEKMKPSPE